MIPCFQLVDKYKVLGTFILFSFNNGFAWLMFDPVSGWLETNVSGFSLTQLELLSSWQPLVFLTMSIPIMKMVTRSDGLRMAVRLGASAEVIGAFLKLIGISMKATPAGLLFLHLGQICSGVGSPVATGCASALSATWFEPHERTRATAAAVLFNCVGNAICYLLVPRMTSDMGFVSVTVYELVVAGAAVLLAWMLFPQERVRVREIALVEMEYAAPVDHMGPQEAALCSEESAFLTTHHLSLASQITMLLKIPSCVCLLLMYGWLCGGYAAWISFFSATFHTFYDEQFIGVISFFGMTSYVVGGLISSYVVDLHFPQHMKHVIFFCISLNAVSNLLFIVCTPDDEGFSVLEVSKSFIVFSTALCGFWNGAAAPLFFELVAEISFPVDEGVSGICISICENFGALLFYQVVARFCHGQLMSVAYAVGMIVAVVLSAAVKQTYNRSLYAHRSQQGEGVFH